MRIRHWFVIACGAALLAGATVAAAQADTSAASSDLDGLVRVKSTRFDEVYLRPAADFRGYTRVMLNRAEVTFATNWRKDLNSQRIALLQTTTPEAADRIAGKMRRGLGDSFANAFKRAGYEIVAAPGANVLSLSLRVIDLSITAPDTITVSVPGRVYTFDAGAATLVLEVRDSTTKVLLGRVVDRRTAGDRGSFRSSLLIMTPVSNRDDFGRLFDLWARSYVQSLEGQKAQPPVVMN